MSRNGTCTSCFGFVERALRRAFIKLSHVLTSHPLPFIVIPILVTLALLPSFIRFNYVHDIEYLYTPMNGPAKEHRDVFASHFPNNDTHLFSAQRKTDEEGFLRVILTDTSSEQNIFTEAGLDIIRDVDRVIKNYTTKEDGLRYADLCGMFKGSCYDNALIRLIGESSFSDVTVSYPTDGNEFLGNELGDVRVDDSNVVQSAGSVLLTYNVRYLDDDTAELSSTWMDEVKDELLTLTPRNTKLSVATTDSLNDELDQISQHVVPLFAVAYVLLSVFSMVTCMMFDWIRSKNMIATAGYVSTALAIVSGMALLVACGVPFASICSTMPFLLMGIGIDNMFVMVGIWRETSIRSPVKDRMEQTLSKAAVSITLTSLTDCLAFGIGCISPFRSVRFFCAYAGVACAFCYVYSVTFLAACLVYSGRWEEQNRHVGTGRKIDPAEAAKRKAADGHTLWKIFCWGSAIYHDNHEISEDSTPEEVAAKKSTDSIPDILVPYATQLIEYPYAHVLLKAPIKFLVLLTYCAYIGVAIWGCIGLEEGLELQNLAPDNSYLADFYPQYDSTFGSQFSGRIMVAMTETLDYTDARDLERIDKLVDSFRQDKKFFPEDEMLEFWLYDFQEYLHDEGHSYPGNMPTFIALLRGFLSLSGYDRFETDVQFSDDDTSIISSRFLIQAGGVGGATDERDLVIRCRELVDDSDIDSVAYFRAFVYWEQYIIITRTTLTNLGIAIASVLFVALLLVPSLTALVMVALSICSITVGLMGFMSLWDVNLDSVSMINLVMCIGFSVDFSAHICYHFSIAGDDKSGHKRKTIPANSNPEDGVNGVSYKKTGSENGGIDHLADNGSIKFSNGDAQKVQNGHTHTNGINPATTDPVMSSDVPRDESQREAAALSGNEKATQALAQLGLPIIQGAATTILAVAVLSGSPDYIHRTFFKTIFLVMCFGFYHAMIILPVVLSCFNDCCSKICRKR